MVTPYYADEHVALYLGDFREVLPSLDITADLIVADPPYGETSLDWDVWPAGWPAQAALYARSMWCFGSMRMFLEQRHEFSRWKLSQDIVWEKHNGTGFDTERFKRVHEHALHWYQGRWDEVRHETPRVARTGPPVAHVVRQAPPPHRGEISTGAWVDDGTRIQTSVLRARSMHRNGAINETEKPVGLLEPLIAYGCPPGGLVLDVFAGSSSTLAAARNIGRRGIGVEKRESQCEKAALRLSQGVLDFGGAEDGPRPAEVPA